MSRRQQRRRTGTTQRGSTPAARARVRIIGARLHRSLDLLVRKRPIVIAGLLVLFHVLLALWTFEPQPHTGGDNAAYITLGRSLLEHGSYRELWDPAEPPHTKYPPVFPALLALSMLLGLRTWLQLKFVLLACSAAAVAFSFLWIRARGRPGLALGVGALLAVAPGVLREGRWILSDVPFWAFTMIALWAFERLRPDDWKRFAVAAVATLAALFTRSAGLPLVIAAFAWLGWRRHWRQLAALGIIIGLPALLWWLRSRALDTGGYVSEMLLVSPYLPELGHIGPKDLLERIWLNDRKYLSIHLPTLLAGTRGWLWEHLDRILNAGTVPPLFTGGSLNETFVGTLLFPLGLMVLLLTIYGWACRIRRPRVADLFLPLYLGLISIWPSDWSGERFLLPALPIALFLAGEGVVRLARRFAPSASFVAAAASAALLLILAAPGLKGAARWSSECKAEYRSGNPYPCIGPYWGEYFRMSMLAGTALPDSSIMISRNPRMSYVLSGLQGRIYPFTESADTFFAAIDSAGARYLLFDGFGTVSNVYVQPMLIAHPDAFCVMRAEEYGTVLFGIRPYGRGAMIGGPLSPDAISFAYCGVEYWRDEAMKQRYSNPPRR